MEDLKQQGNIIYQQETADIPAKKPKLRSVFRSLGLGLITGAADDDPSAIGTYASAGAKFVPLTYPIKYKGKYSPETRGRIKRVRYGLDKEEIRYNSGICQL
jgi:hypothetical protein